MSGEDAKKFGAKWGWVVPALLCAAGWAYQLGVQAEQIGTLQMQRQSDRSRIHHLEQRDHQLTEMSSEMRHLRQTIERLERRFQ